ncbi:unnamed protein product [Diabrotica balteata]|uniref:Mitochondrial import inner membrane translocase subunit TIM50 n=1 Tax=Diabrotica balteata TaxID=107213 RepID=A0A9N9T6W9_DIABA|nr:unnamed protein product [Diabrotica balteata]
MWGTTKNLLGRNLKIIYANKHIQVLPLNNLALGRYLSSSNDKNEPNITVVDRQCTEKDFAVKEAINIKQTARKLKVICALLGLSVTLLGTFMIIELQKPEEVGSGIPKWKTYIKRLLKQIENITLFIQEPSRDKLLPDPVKYPYYQPPYTLVLEFTDVMAHPDWTYHTGWRFKKRPGLDYLLENLVDLYEIVVFTAQPGMSIFPVIEAMDPKNLISYKLVRDSTHFVDGLHVKNLDKLNRDLSKVIVVDWNAECIKFHPDNHLNVDRWQGENDDTVLLDLTSFLKTIAHMEVEDVREVLKFYKQYDDPLTEFRRKQIQFYEEQKDIKQEHGRLSKTTPKFFSKLFNYLI